LKRLLPLPPGRVALWIFSVAFLLRLGFALTVPDQRLLIGDQFDYASIADNLAAGGGFAVHPGIPTPDRAPFYPLVMAAVYKTWGSSHRAVLFLQAVLGAATCLLLLWLLREVVQDEKAAQLGAWLLAFHPVTIVYCGRLLTETLFTFLTLLSMLLLARHLLRGRPWEAIMAGLVMGLATLTRPGSLFMPWLALGLMLLYGSKRAIAWLGYAAVFYLLLVPWLNRNQELFGFRKMQARGPGFGLYVTGHMTQGMSYDDAADAYNALVALPEYKELVYEKGRSPQAELDKRTSREGKELILAHPFTYAWIVLKRIPPFWITSHSSAFDVDRPISQYRRQGRWTPIAFRGALMLLQTLIVAGAAWGLWLLRGRWREALFLASVPLYVNIHLSFDMIPRYHVPALPFLLGLAALPLSRFLTRYRQTHTISNSRDE
jgi:4-amino-4-deoxy-L-arabinose transferase-like glycosyltransferase